MKESKTTEISMSVYFIHLLFVIYFVVLTAERIQSIVRSVWDPDVLLFGDGFNCYTYLITFASLAVSLIYLIASNGNLFAGIFTRSAQVHGSIQMGRLCIATGLILISGMVHTEYTVAPIQFGAYGALIVAMIIQTARKHRQSDKRILLWLSVAFLTAFSMAIPVMYRSNITHAGLFHVLEALTALVLVAIFTGMFYKVFCEDATNLFYILPMLTAVALDTVLIVMRWQEEINWFVLVSLIATCVLFLIGRLWNGLLSRDR
ncbi:MAG: hypothetical protein E7624_04190 [Ruminococcaceae bacterium]|nr:hypothetical protein [Oscillospiraceae bacterium]